MSADRHSDNDDDDDDYDDDAQEWSYRQQSADNRG